MGSRFHFRESPARQVYVSEFDIANMPVTVGQFGTFIESDAYQQKRWWSDDQVGTGLIVKQTVGDGKIAGIRMPGPSKKGAILILW